MWIVLSNLFCGTVRAYESDITFEAKNEIGFKLFKIKLSTYNGQIENLLKNLNVQEILRSQKYHFEKDSNSFIIRRALLKMVLAEYIGLHANQITIAIHKNKKPYLPSHPSVFFNVSHTTEYALVAIGDSPIGVDVEKVDQEHDYSDTLKHLFNKVDRDILASASNPKRTFFTFWTRKEAIVKATGKGIGDDFTHIPASDGLHNLQPDVLGTIQNISVFSFKVDEHHLGSVAVSGIKNDIKIIHFSAPPLL